jgi:outer membrane protein assembly factor BamB
MRVATVLAVVVLSVATVLTAAPDAASARDAAQPARLLVALREQDGSVLWRARPRGAGGGHLDAKYVTHGLVVTEESVCLSGERRYEPGDVSVVAFDSRTGRQRWRVPDVELSPGTFGRIDPPAEDVATIPVTSTVTGMPELLDVENGSLVGPVAGQPVAASGDVLLVVALDAFRATAGTRGIVTALDRRTGAPRWTKNLGANLFSVAADGSDVGIAAGPIPDPGTELGQSGGVEVLDPVTGQRRWAALLMPGFGIELAGGRLVFQNLDHLRGVDVATGQIAWDVPADGTIDSNTAPTDTLVVVRDPTTGATGLVSSFDPRSGALRWKRAFVGDQLSPGIATDRAVVVGTHDRVVAYEPSRGRRLWTRPTPTPAGGLVAGGGRVYISGGCTVSND